MNIINVNIFKLMKFNKNILRFQAGGQVPADNAPVENTMDDTTPYEEQEQEQEPESNEPNVNNNDEVLNQAAMIAQQLIQEAGPELSAVIFQLGLEILSKGANTSNGMNEQELPPEYEQPSFKRSGGRLVRIR